MEPITTGLIANYLWDNFGQQLFDKTKDKFINKVVENTDTFLTKLPFKKEENEIIVTEIANAVSNKEINNEKTFINFLNNSEMLKLALDNLKQTKNDIEILNSFKKLTNSDIEVKGKTKIIKDSFENIKDCKIKI